MVSRSLSSEVNRGMRMNARMEEFRFREVQLLKEDLCGSGSYGRVCKAMVDQLVCAAKLIHPTFFKDLSPTATKTFQQFQQECDFLSAIRHPCIVQYLGTTQDVESGLLVLLMELMDESLTRFLERKLSHNELVPYHTQVNVTHDVCMALSFLHSNGIVHRDLSSNNILLIAESRAKVTDFGMSKIVENNPRMTPLTQCPGCLVYMAPEALRTPPTYSEKLDVFSMGVCMVQIITCKFPNPGNAKRTIEDPRHGMIEVPIPERERRRNDIAGIRDDHPLLCTALDCLADAEANRPSSKDLCHRMMFYKSQDRYSSSLAHVARRKEFLGSLEASLADKDRLIDSLHTEVEQKQVSLKSLESQLESQTEGVVAKKNYEIKRLKAELEQVHLQLTEHWVHRKNNVSLSPRQQPAGSLALSLTSSHSTLEEDFDKLDSPDLVENMEEQLSIDAPPPSMWYHGPLNRMVACQRLEAVKRPGAFLVRESCNDRGAMVLSFVDGELHIHHFRITRNEQGQFNIGGNIWFSTLERLVGFHMKYSSVVEKHSERLEHPVPPPYPVSLPAPTYGLQQSL